RQLKNDLSILSSTFGEALAPVVRENIDLLKGWLSTATDWVKNNQALIQHYARLAVTAGKYFLMVRGGWLISKLVYNSTLGWLFGLVRGGWRGVATIVRLTHEYRTLGKSSSLLFNLTMKAGGGFKKLWGKMRGLGPLASRLATGAGRLGRVLGGGLLRGLMAAGRAVLFIGRALLMNPIGLLITGIAVAAYLIYRYWEPIKGFFTRLWMGIENIGTQIWSSITGFFTDRWQDIQTAFDGG
ncbi:hypothetical protein LED50_28315, partial [Salmonella enterica]|nr:hypothetical protein [Salmonella enterica]